VLIPGDGATATICLPVTGDAVALLGDNRKLLICKIDEIPEMSRGRGVMLQRYKEGGLADAKIFRLAEGLSWRQGESRTRTETDLTTWLGARAASGRLVPNGFPKGNKFG
jgi:topoisomerase-4 subunit A